MSGWDAQMILWFVGILAAVLLVVGVVAFIIDRLVVSPWDRLLEMVQEKAAGARIRLLGSLSCGRVLALSFLSGAVICGVAVYLFMRLGSTSYRILFLVLACVFLVSSISFLVFPGDTDIKYGQVGHLKTWGLSFIRASKVRYKIIWGIGLGMGILVWVVAQMYVDASIFPVEFVELFLDVEYFLQNLRK